MDPPDKTEQNRVIICICVVGFHHLRGTEVEWIYPRDHGLSVDALYVYVQNIF